MSAQVHLSWWSAECFEGRQYLCVCIFTSTVAPPSCFHIIYWLPRDEDEGGEQRAGELEVRRDKDG